MDGSHTGLCLTIDGLNALRPCTSDGRRVRAALRELNADKAHCFTAAEAREAGCTFDDIVWAASAVAENDKAVERRLRHWMADCAARVLHIFEARYPADDRPRKSIEAARLFADGEIDAAARAGALAAARDAARAAARAAAWDAASAVASAAAGAGARAAARAAASSPAAAARAAAWDAASAVAGAARDAEEQWQFDRLILWLSDPEPEPLPLPSKVMGDAA